MDNFPLVSICSTTYNLESYINEALESWLMQVTTFPFEIVICDDFSKDNTIEIIENVITKYPGKIRLIKAEKNLGMMPNYIKSLKAANGKYIAVCDGDDYWIDPNKLQMQVDFLEQNPDFVACLTNSYILNEDTKEKRIAKEQIWDIASSKELLYHDDFKDNIPLSPGHISTYLFRNNLIEDYPDWFYDEDVVTDFPLLLMNSRFGKSKFLNIITSVYRKRSGSHSLTWYSFLKIQKSRIKMYNCVNEYLEYSCNHQIKTLIAKHYINIFKYYRKKGYYFKALIALVKAIGNNSKEVILYVFKNRI